jgi:thiamine pyrophosphokinase
LGAFGGRFDQEISNIHALFRWQNKFHRIVLMGDNNVTFLVEPGLHTIIPVNAMEGKKCGILPLGGKVNKVTTTGLKWNLINQEIDLGSFISTSNEIVIQIPKEKNNEKTENFNKVTIETSDSLIWTCSYDNKI